MAQLWKMIVCSTLAVPFLKFGLQGCYSNKKRGNMQVISKKLKKNNNSPRGVIPDTRKLFRNNSAWRIIISIVAFLTLSVNGFAFLSSKAFADAEVTFTVNVPDAALLEVELFNTDGTALGSTASIDVVPSLSSAGFNEKSMVVSVGTNNEWGYNLVMSVSNTALTSAESNTIANLVEDTTNHANGYTCTAETAGTCDFTLNSWGFRIDRATTLLSATNYIPVPSTLNLNKNATTTNGDPTYVSFGSRINASQAPGEYTTTITFAATANPDPTPTMQSITSSNVASYLPNVGDTITMKDSRDQKTYTVGKLADNKYWMLDNLALDLTDDDILNSLTASNTDIDTTNDPGALAALKGTTLGTTSDKYATAKVANWTTSYSYSAPLVNMDSEALVPQGDNDPLKAEALAGEWKVGGYYNYCAASAGSYCYGNGTSYGTSSGNATSSICPYGWHMPSSNTGGEYAALYSAYSSASPSQYTAFRTAFHLPLSGYYYDGSADYQGSRGRFWSVTRYSNNRMYFLYADTSDINPSYSLNRSNGYSVRCVLDS